MNITCIKENGLCQDEWGDSIASTYFDGYIHGVGQARRAIFASNLHYVWDTSGNIIHKIEAPWDPRSEALLSKLNGKLYVIGSAGSLQDIWVFDPTVAGYTAASWSLVNASFVADIGNRYMAAGGDIGGWFYIAGGWGRTTVYKTQDFLTWTFVANLPAIISKISAPAFFIKDSLLWLVGGSCNMTTEDATGFYQGELNGHVHTMDASGTFTLLMSDQEKFGQVWLDGGTDGTNIFISKGYIDPTAFIAQYPPVTSANPSNNRGIMTSTDGVAWTDISPIDGLAIYHERHRTSMVNAGGIVYTLAGFMGNDMWKFN